MENYVHNSDPNYYITNCSSTNCGSYALNIEGWLDADADFENEVGDISSWVINMAEEGYEENEINEYYANAIVESLLTSFGDELIHLDDLVSLPDSKNELIAFRTFCFYYEDDGWADFDFHFKVFRDGKWMEKNGHGPVHECDLEDWSYDCWTDYNSTVHFFLHKIA